MSASSDIYNAWQKLNKHRDKLDGFAEWLKAHEMEEAPQIEGVLKLLDEVSSQLATKLLDRKRKRG